MNDSIPAGVTRTSRVIGATRETLYRACTDPRMLAAWRAPGAMTATVHEFDARVGGGYLMSLSYPPSEPGAPGKTTDREDRFRSRFVELSPGVRIVEAISFDTDDPAVAGEITMVTTFKDRDGGTEVTIAFGNLPPGIRPEDNETGTRQSLEKLALLVE
jgi:uncharacterized protein YndB with AHSA1/START domain